MLRKRLVIEWWAILAFACLLALFANWSDLTDRFDNLLLDQAIPHAAPPPSDRILIVEIDERSLAEIGSWPWKRSIHAQLIEKISKGRPLAIGYDILFVEASEVAEDAQLAGAVSSSGKVILPFQYQIPGANGRAIDKYMPIDPLPSVAAGVGHVGLRFDPDGLVRRVELKGTDDEFPFYHLMEVTQSFVKSRDVTSVSPPSGAALIPLQPRSSYRTVPASSILNDQISPDFINDKIVLVGASAQGMADIFPVANSVGSIMPGIEIQANLLNGLLANQLVKEANGTATQLASFAAIGILMLAFWRLSPRSNLILSIGLLVAILSASALLVVFARYWVAPGPALLGILLLYPLWGWRRLAALNDFVAHETNRLGAFQPSSIQPSAGLDAVARQAERLRSVIGELTDRQEFIAGVIAAAPDAMCVTDAEERVILANEAAQSLFGEPPVGKSLPELLAFQGRFLNNDMNEWTSKSGTTALITKSATTSGKGGETLGSIYGLADITQIREAERERKEMLEFLSHDMRSPQAAIVSLVDGGQRADTESEDVLPRIRKHAVRTLKLTDDFVQLARLESVELRLDDYDLVELLREAIDANFEASRTRAIRVAREDDGECHYIAVDGALVVRALSNLINNAIKYAPEGSIIRCRLWSARQPDGLDERVFCEISDQGPGLPLQRRADPFGRFGYRDEAQAIGSGLGLAFVKRAVERNGGMIECHSSETEGTRFVINFAELSSD